MTIWIITIEPHEQRYTSEWHIHVPQQIQAAALDRGSDEPVRVIDGGETGSRTTPGAFFNFAETNIFKSTQTAEIARLFKEGEVRPGDRFLFTDAWHPGAISLRYMSDLLTIPVRIYGLWHAGSYDPHDFLGRLQDRSWTMTFERALFETYEISFFATDFHIAMFKRGFGIGDDVRIQRAAWPMEYLKEVLQPFQHLPKRNLVLFPHRLAPEKQVEIFEDLSGEFPSYEFRVCQKQQLTKAEYHRLLGEARLVFSASLQETLGIGCFEGLLCGAIPLAPDRLSYAEMYPDRLLYPSAWTLSWASYQHHKRELVQRIEEALWLQERFPPAPQEAASRVCAAYFEGQQIYSALLDQ